MKVPQGKLLALVAVFAAIGIITATGAFTTVTATRTADVSVSGDASALLAIEGADGPNSDYTTTSDGVFQIDFSQQGDVNPNAQTDIQRVFVITNQGTQSVNVSISDTDTADGESNGESDMVTFYNVSQHGAEAASGDLESGSVELEPGDSLTVSIYIDTTGFTDDADGDGDLIDEVEIVADQSE